MAITRDEAIRMEVGRVLHHETIRNRDGTPLRVRVSGKCRTWKRRPDHFELPVKHGLRVSLTITPENAGEWCLDADSALWRDGWNSHLFGVPLREGEEDSWRSGWMAAEAAAMIARMELLEHGVAGAIELSYTEPIF